jgi:hypothetical protein
MPSKTRSTRQPASSPAGLGIDAQGAPAVDPTENVIALTEAANKRQDDLRQATIELFTQSQRHSAFIAELRATHQRELNVAESRRLDAIRQVDREDVTKSASQAQAAIQTLAIETRTTAETLRNQVSTTAQVREQQLSVQMAEISKRISALELALSEGKGKSQVVEPRQDKLTDAVETLVSAQAAQSGTMEGSRNAWAILITGLGLIATLVVLGTAAVTLILFLNRTPSPAYVPAPSGTTLPTAPPTVPR